MADDLTNVDLNPQGDNQTDQTGDPEPIQGQPSAWPDKLDSDDKRLHAYKSVQGGFTKLSQQNKELQQQIQALQEEKNKLNRPTFLPADQGQPAPTGGDYDPYDEAAADARAMKAAKTILFADIFDKEYGKNPTEFMERNNYVQNLIAQRGTPETPTQLEALFVEADNVRKNTIRNNVFKGLEEMLGRPVTEDDKAKFQNMFAAPDQTQTQQQDQPTGFMPDTTGGTRPDQDTTQQQMANLNQQIEEARKAGDHELVAQLIFQKALLE
jgi:hypothetical protein